MKRFIPALISIALLAFLLWRVDTAALIRNFRATRWDIFAAAIALFIPQIIVIAWRWKRLIAPFTTITLSESIRLVLAGATMNLILPGKMGDLTKGWFLARAGAITTPLGLGIVVFEKMLDVATLAVFMLGGVFLIFVGLNATWLPGGTEFMSPAQALQNNPVSLPIISLVLALALGIAAIIGMTILYFVPLNRVPGMPLLMRLSAHNPRFAKIRNLLVGSHKTTDALRARGGRRGEIILLSLAIWTLHLTQIYLFFLCLNAAPAPAQFFSMIPLAIFIGLVPISIAGFGTRDTALVTLLPGLPQSAVLAAALYINLRYIIPAAAGLPFLARYSIRSEFVRNKD